MVYGAANPMGYLARFSSRCDHLDEMAMGFGLGGD
jgi:hypothetical protein